MNWSIKYRENDCSNIFNYTCDTFVEALNVLSHSIHSDIKSVGKAIEKVNMDISSNKWYIIFENSAGNKQTITKNPEDYAEAIASFRHLKDRDLTILDTNVQ